MHSCSAYGIALENRKMENATFNKGVIWLTNKCTGGIIYCDNRGILSRKMYNK